MGRPLESKNKQKCYTTLSHCLSTQVEADDRPTTNPQATKSPKKTQLDKAASSQKAGKSTLSHNSYTLNDQYW